ncbi:MAG: FAD-dependent oxidoreductase [Flavobacteriales bacterium]|nr:FAD-dependent oxidoreductase [Flavobacteriales bacterium]
MTRKEFINTSLAMGIGLPFLSSILASCSKEAIEFPEFQTDFTGKVLIIGAGSAGLAAGYLLKRYGVDFEIIEASSNYGGRLKRADNFVDVPLDLGAEWIHASPSVLTEILNDPSINDTIDFISYNPQEISSFDDGTLTQANFASNFYNEYKFKSTSWFGFFEKYIYPHVVNRTVYNQPVVQIDSSSDVAQVTTADGTVYEADKVIITIPIKVLQQENIEFIPSLSSEKRNAINSISVGDGFKAFIEFEEKFYPDLLAFGGVKAGLSADNKFHYDAVFRKDTTRNVLGLFTINEPASAYTSLGSDQETIDYMLAELDEIFDGQASQHYIQHVIQNWSADPYIRGAYSYEFSNDQEDTVNAIKAPINNKIYFAGEALTIQNQSTIHGAAETGYLAVEQVLTQSKDNKCISELRTSLS